ncbi:uncharacterized protein N7496_004653 [Penicillium cataractarum]|uniref:Uncharacterized protein n=1 Tax=Penicillium cataractarum TaxID=2100454 RepID=A0A9W9VDZ4_9EURO|nr:uncharacterized protein N7496_004653 [Penicillium cataractarum]KAJ5377244.1 hypothetical protein N7496_004653 [Penicillium cataractarum]
MSRSLETPLRSPSHRHAGGHPRINLVAEQADIIRHHCLSFQLQHCLDQSFMTTIRCLCPVDLRIEDHPASRPFDQSAE